MATEEKKKPVDLGLLEEEDEFEEFPVEEWDHKDDDQANVNVWEDNWDDDTVEDDFSVQLSKFTRKRALPRSPPLRSPEPAAKKVCSRLSPEAFSSYTPQTNGTPSTNGHAGGDSTKDTPGRSTRSSSRTTRGSRQSPADTNNEDSPPSRATRSSARLRSARK